MMDLLGESSAAEALLIPTTSKLRSKSWNLAVAQEVGQMLAFRCDEAWTRFAKGSQLPSIIVVTALSAAEGFRGGAY